jgi:outer membrane cobalamin receptor
MNYNYTYLEARDLHTKKWLTERPRHLHKLRFKYSPNLKWDMEVSGVYRTKTFANDTNTTRLKHYFLVNFSSSYQLTDSMKVMFTVNNIFNRRFQEKEQYPMPGRVFYGGIKISF